MLIADARVPLAAKYPEPAEHLAPHLILAAQIAGAGVLFPLVMRGRLAAVQLIATALPFQLAAGYLAGLSTAAMAEPAIAVGLWLVALGAWGACLSSARSRMLGVAMASCLSLGGGLLHYLRLEFAPGSAGGFESASPLLTALRAVEGSGTILGWLTLVGLAGGGLLVRVGFCRRRRQGETNRGLPAAAMT
jgi:hypothetical protein